MGSASRPEEIEPQLYYQLTIRIYSITADKKVFFIVKIFSLLPFRLLYLLSDFMAWLACDVVRYRRNVVRQNLTSSFPEKDIKEIRRIEKQFYLFLCDYFMETIKLATMS